MKYYILKLQSKTNDNIEFSIGMEDDFLLETVKLTKHPMDCVIRLTLIPIIPYCRKSCINYSSMEHLMDVWDIVKTKIITSENGIMLHEPHYKTIWLNRESIISQITNNNIK